jgi:riboflavin biosynthesis pyrimidine reductase
MESIFTNFKDLPNSQLLVEAGPKLLQELINLNLVQKLYLTVNLNKTGENRIDLNSLLSNFKLIHSEQVEGCEFKVFQLSK